MGTYPFTLLRRRQNPLSYYTLSNESKHNILLALVGKANPKKNSFPSRNKHENHEIGILDMLWVWGMAGHSKTCIDGPFCRTSVKTTICKRRASVKTTLSPPPPSSSFTLWQNHVGAAQGARLTSLKLLIVGVFNIHPLDASSIIAKFYIQFS
jgi:hypothetical protein